MEKVNSTSFIKKSDRQIDSLWWLYMYRVLLKIIYIVRLVYKYVWTGKHSVVVSMELLNIIYNCKSKYSFQ